MSHLGSQSKPKLLGVIDRLSEIDGDLYEEWRKLMELRDAVYSLAGATSMLLQAFEVKDENERSKIIAKAIARISMFCRLYEKEEGVVEVGIYPYVLGRINFVTGSVEIKPDAPKVVAEILKSYIDDVMNTIGNIRTLVESARAALAEVLKNDEY